MNTKIQYHEEFIQNWYDTAEYLLTNDTQKLSKEEIDLLLAEATYTMTDEEAENFLKSLGGVVSKGLKVIAPVAKSLAPVLGTVAGAVIGGPVGAKLGGALGGAIANIGNKPQQTSPSTGVQHQRTLPGGIIPSTQNVQSNPALIAPTPANVSQNTANHAPVANQLLMLINNPDFLIRLLQTVIPNRSKSGGINNTSENFMQDVYTINRLTEELINNSTKDIQEEHIEETSEDNDLYYDEDETLCCGCSH